MKMEKDKALDNLFKKGLEDPVYETGYRDEDWDALEQLMDKPKKRPAIVFWLTALSSAAAVLIFLGWLFFKPTVVPTEQQQAVIVHPALKNTNNGGDKVQQSIKTQTEVSSDNNKLNVASIKGSHKEVSSKPEKQLVFTAVKPEIRSRPAINISDNNNQSNQNNKYIEEKLYSNNTSALAAVNPGLIIDDASGNVKHSLRDVKDRDLVGNLYKPTPVKEEDENETTKLGFLKHPQLALTFLGAPELNSTNAVDGAKTGTNFGMLFSAGIFKNLTVSTGATYSTKPYSTDIANYHTGYTFKNNPSEIEADCRMLDIPVNVDYQLYSKNKNKFSIGTGLSSYIMLHESYQYYYANAATGPAGFTVPHSGKYFFGIANIQATYQRQINSKVGLSFQPYMKLPLGDIGYSQVRLQTLGVAVGLNWKLNSLTKP